MIGNLAGIFQDSTLKFWLAAHFGPKALDLPNEDATQAYWEEIERQRETLYPRAERKIAALFRREANAVIAALDEEQWPPTVWVEVFGDKNETAWREAIEEIHRRTAQKFAERTDDQLDGNKWMLDIQTKDTISDLWALFIGQYIERYVGESVLQILDTTRDALKEAIAAGIREGEGVYELTRRVRALYDGWSTSRAEMIARYEVMAASNYGSLAAARATSETSGLRLEKTWVRTYDSRVRPHHAEAGGQQKPLDEPFIVMGQQLMHPGDGSLGASADNLVRCRCTMSYITVR